jgi:hypothetical protein
VETIPSARGLAYPDIIEAVLERKIRALWIIATNPVVSFPNLKALQQALENLEFLVVQDGYHPTPTTESGRADLCALARPHLASSAWTLHAAAELKYHGVEWPAPYRTAQTQLERNIERAALLARQV